MADTESKKIPAIGIDLGTTYSCVGVWRDGRVEIIPNTQGNRVTPSYVAYSGEERLIGDSAKNQGNLNPTNTIFDAKRLIGRAFNDPVVQKDMKNWPFRVVDDGGQPCVEVTSKDETKRLKPQEISAMVLGYLKETAETYLGGKVVDAVITVPAHFDNSQRQATKDAGAIAGLNVLRIINEPTAAALCYGLGDQTSKKVLIYDLGGGTFDVTVLSIDDGVFEVQATGGDTHLGGEDFDNLLVDFLVKEFNKKTKLDMSKNARALRRLRTACEKAKRTLSSGMTAQVEVDALFEGVDFNIAVSRAKFEELCAPMFKKCIETVKSVLKDAKITKNKIDEVVLVGGSTRIPKIQKDLSDFFGGKELCKSVNPDEAVAYGAAVQAAILTGQKEKQLMAMVLLDVTPLSLGIETTGRVMSVIVPRNTTIPCTKSDKFTTEENNQTVITIDVYEGERATTTANNKLGTFDLEGILPAPRGVPSILVTFQLDANGILTVSAEDQLTKKKNNITIRNNRGRLDQSQIQQMIQDEEKNRRADELFRKRVEARNELENYVYSMQSSVRSMEKISSSDKATIEDAVNDVLNWLDSESSKSAQVEDFAKKQKEVEGICSPIITKLYRG